MTRYARNIRLLEGLWILLTGVVIGLCLFPIAIYAPEFPFFVQNALLIAAFITCSRYFLFLPLTPIAHRKWIKVVWILLSVILVFVISTALGDYRNYIDETGLLTVVDHLHVTEQSRIISYMKNEMVFFGVGSILAAILLTFRLIVSLWRMRNTGRV